MTPAFDASRRCPLCGFASDNLTEVALHSREAHGEGAADFPPGLAGDMREEMLCAEARVSRVESTIFIGLCLAAFSFLVGILAMLGERVPWGVAVVVGALPLFFLAAPFARDVAAIARDRRRLWSEFKVRCFMALFRLRDRRTER